MARWGMVIDLDKCVGCQACSIACKAENNVPHGSPEEHIRRTAPFWHKVIAVSSGEYPAVGINLIPMPCMHCEDPPCVAVCPARATYRRYDGIVIQDFRRCIGCKYCVMTCPFEVPKFNESTQNISKCHLCHDRVANGLTPACAKACPTGAIVYGERDKLIAEAKANGANYIYGENELKGLHVMYVLEDSPDKYGLPVNPKVPTSVVLWKNFIKPLVKWGIPLTIVGVLLHFWLHGPHVVEEGGEK